MDPKPSCDGVLLKCGNTDTDKHGKKSTKDGQPEEPRPHPSLDLGQSYFSRIVRKYASLCCSSYPLCGTWRINQHTCLPLTVKVKGKPLEEEH